MKQGGPEAAVQNPFPGLRPFEGEDSTLFFGRDEQIGEALDRLLRGRLLAVLGLSGCGKSSLVRAGMVPALQMGLAGDPEQRWHVATMRPGDGPLRELARCLEFPEGALAERTYGLLEAVETHLAAGENLLLVVDQFEEIFSFRERKLRQSGGSEADLFVSYLLRAAQDPSGRVYVLLTMRSDYLGECAKFNGLPEALNDGQYLVPRMTRDQLQQAIEGPLEAAGVDIHPALAQDLLNQCDDEPDNLPLLQHLLRRMFEEWEESGAEGAITAGMATSVGGLAAALDADAERVYSVLSPGAQESAEILFRRITESRQTDREEEDRPVRRPQPLADLAALARVPEPALASVVAAFEQRGLLVRRQTDRGDVIDLPHECLCLKWQRLKQWIRAEAEDAKKLRFLLDAVGKSYLTGLALGEAHEWRREGRLDDAWPRRYVAGAQLSEAVAWVAESQRRVEEAEAQDRLRREERRKEAEERGRRARGTALVLGVAFLISLGFGIWAGFSERSAHAERREADRQAGLALQKAKEAEAARTKAERLAAAETEQESFAAQAKEHAEEEKKQAEEARAEAQNQAASAISGRLAVEALSGRLRPDVAGLLAAEAREIADGFESRNALLRTLQANLAAGNNPQVLGDVLRGHTASVRSVAFSTNGKLLASASDDDTVRLWDAETRKQIGAPLEGHSGRVNSVAFNIDGTLLVSGSADQTIRVWDAAGHKQSGEALKGHSRGVNSVAFSPNGKLIASGSTDQTIRLWDAASRGLVGELKGHTKGVNAVAFSPNGRLLASASDDGTVRFWDVAARAAWGEPLTGHKGHVLSVAFDREGKLLASSGADGTVRLWDVPSRGFVGEPLEGGSSFILGVAFSRDRALLASGGLDEAVHLWQLSNRQQLGDPLRGHRNRVNAVAFSPGGRTVASASDDQTIILWDIDPDSWAARLCQLVQRNLSAGEWLRFVSPEVSYQRTCPDLPAGGK